MKISQVNLEETPSTQDYAKSLAENGASEGTVVKATTQARGRGRLGRRWLSPPGGLWFSVILRPVSRPSEITGLTLMAAVSIAEAVNTVTDVKAGIKWPNDILVGGKKLGGILTEMTAEMNRVRYVILGVGVNVNFNTSILPHDLLMPATSLEEETGREVDLDGLLEACLANLNRDYEGFRENFADIISRWKALSVVIGQNVVVSQPGRVISGIAVDIDKDGALLVKDGEGIDHLVHAGDLSIIR
jgi:BirA family biotin operon repressor/biotin-[acetyl-CoA-carboxylase] ligase